MHSEFLRPLQDLPPRRSEWGPRQLPGYLLLAVLFGLLGAALGGAVGLGLTRGALWALGGLGGLALAMLAMGALGRALAGRLPAIMAAVFLGAGAALFLEVAGGADRRGLLYGAAVGVGLCLLWTLLKASHDMQDLVAEARALATAGRAGEAHSRDELQLAEKTLREAVEGLERRTGSRNLLALGLLRCLAGSVRARREYARAATLYLQTLPVYEQLLGEEHPVVGTVLCDLAACYLALGDSWAGHPVALRAANLRVKVLGGESPEAAEANCVLAALMLLVGEDRQALELASGALRTLGDRHPEVSATVARAHFKLQQFQDAEALYRRSLEEAGPDPFQRARLSLGLGETLVAQDRLQEAGPLYGQALRLIQTEIGNERGILTDCVAALKVLLTRAEQLGEVTEPMRAIRLMEICLACDRAGLRALHGQHPDLGGWKDFSGWTGLQWAAYTGDPELVRLLLDLGASWRAGQGHTMTAMDVAVSYNHYYVIKKLIEAGADWNLAGVDGMTPIHWAARRGRELTVDKLISQGVDYNRKDVKGRTPLHMAAMLGHLDTALALIAQQVPLNVPDHTGQTSLHIAAGKGNVKLVEALLEGGADPSIREKSQNLTPLALAERLGHREVVRILKSFMKAR